MIHPDETPRTHCEDHYPPFPLAGRGDECLLCVGREIYVANLDPGVLRIPYINDDPALFVAWLEQECSGREALYLERLRTDLPGVMAEYRWDSGFECEYLTIKISVCAWCNGFLGVTELRGDDARRDKGYIVSHGKCDACIAKEWTGGTAGFAGQRAAEMAKGSE